MSSVTLANGEKHTCQLCGYQTLKKTHMKLHEQADHDGKKFQCPECEYQATQKNIVVRHQKSVHMG
jgi:KRAB domain-containing zinc finger protein